MIGTTPFQRHAKANATEQQDELLEYLDNRVLIEIPWSVWARL
jgi:hypothetical protein